MKIIKIIEAPIVAICTAYYVFIFLIKNAIK